MQITMLSVAAIILTILKCHNMINLEWWMVFSPAVVDLIIGFFRYLEKKGYEEAFLEALTNELEEEDK